ncbi:MAG: hypothetical protein KIH62_004465 [Candidatus Kerfeldbacteria bacterium]|nr:hypothetical protein [Candidatus Kerfeldbacteria bacterium]
MSPYVISQDIKILLERWARQSGCVLPPTIVESVREALYKKLGDIFPGILDIIHEGELVEGVNALVRSAGMPVISMDPVYYAGGSLLGMSRMVHPDLQNAGHGRRNGDAAVLRQLSSLPRGDVIVVDDVIFSGEMMERVVRMLANRGTRVRAIVCGVAIGEGRERLAALDIPVHSVRHYDSVVDELCERDFFPGVPLSGRQVRTDGNVGAPYILPFGKPASWASIPEKRCVEFSRTCLELTRDLFTGVEEASGRAIATRDLPRGVLGVPSDSRRFCDVLTELLRES